MPEGLEREGTFAKPLSEEDEGVDTPDRPVIKPPGSATKDERLASRSPSPGPQHQKDNRAPGAQQNNHDDPADAKHPAKHPSPAASPDHDEAPASAVVKQSPRTSAAHNDTPVQPKAKSPEASTAHMEAPHPPVDRAHSPGRRARVSDATMSPRSSNGAHTTPTSKVGSKSQQPPTRSPRNSSPASSNASPGPAPSAGQRPGRHASRKGSLGNHQAPSRSSPSKPPKAKSADSQTSAGKARIQRRTPSKKGLEYNDSRLKAHIKINVFVNGEENTPSRTFLLDPRRVPTFDRLMDYLTAEIQPLFGPIMRLAHAEDYSFLLGYDQVEDGMPIIACGRAGLKRLNYLKIPSYKERAVTKISSATLNKSRFDDSHVESRVTQNIARAKVIQALPAGDEDGVPQRIVIPPADLDNWERVLELFTEKCSNILWVDDVKKIFTLEGEEIEKGSDLKEDEVYVASHLSVFKPTPFQVIGGRICRKPTQKTRPVLPKIVARPKNNRKVLAAFGRTGAGIMDGKAIPDPDMAQKRRRRSLKAQPQSSLPPLKRVSDVHVEGTRPWYQISNQDEAVEAVDQLISQLAGWGEQTDEERHDVLMLMQRRIRDRLFEMRQQSPEVTTAFDDRIEEILNFMMQAPGTEEDDRSAEAVQQRFSVVVDAAISGRLAHWESTPASLVALVILLDQFPRSIHANSKRMFAGDDMAKAVVLRALFHSHLMDEVHPVYRVFPCMALTHQEDLEMQKLAESEWTRACDYFTPDDPIREYKATFESNRQLIERFGRFPERNELLGRTTTAEEREYMAEQASSEA
ncbi:uncharacterized protein MONBRDRAFT_28678 [Monosiga brevicollis MX1]|uniref:Doublecortin domain-containing protein n=1 Tax=Monosiga brevicollis TaxID=81824 RepID=A9V8V4_MONBE|nr:uncharacterized protein MONBRDRAFT_28678 [Monosiga brevicollis MX1]EDQ85939.1 predicted protein [Monosiga brevicollis MX1]|eukprot:XP_001749133.1 hypothetical protein [Monosiga brevicollis MX1]